MADTNKSGKYATVIINGPGSGSGVEFCGITKWTYRAISGAATFINNKTQGKVGRDPSIIDCTGTFTMDQDYGSGDNPFASPISLVEGQILTNLCMYENQTAAEMMDGMYAQAASIMVDSISISTEISMTGKAMIDVAWSSTGGQRALPGGVLH